MCNNSTNIINVGSGPCKADSLQGVGYSLVFLLGFLVNSAALYAFIAKRHSWIDTHVYMCNLAVADFALLLFLPFRIYDAFFCMAPSVLCTHLMRTHFLNMYASIMTTVAISVHRYLIIKFPLQARSWRKKKVVAFAVCLILWGLLFTISVCYKDENRPDKLWSCFERCKDCPIEIQRMYILVFLGFVIPLLIIVFCSSQIIYILLKVNDDSEERKRTIGIVAANMIVFIFCYTPIHVSFLVKYYNLQPIQPLQCSPADSYVSVSDWIASTNCCFDSISYYFLLKRFYHKSVGSTMNSSAAKNTISASFFSRTT